MLASLFDPVARIRSSSQFCHIPGSRCAQPGYGFTIVCGQVARIRRLRRNPGIMKNLSQLLRFCILAAVQRQRDRQRLSQTQGGHLRAETINLRLAHDKADVAEGR